MFSTMIAHGDAANERTSRVGITFKEGSDLSEEDLSQGEDLTSTNGSDKNTQKFPHTGENSSLTTIIMGIIVLGVGWILRKKDSQMNL